MKFMKSISRHKSKIIDSCVLVDCVESKTLNQFLVGLSKNYQVLIIIHVRNEVKNRLISKFNDPKKIVYFEKVLKKLRNLGVINMHPKNCRLGKPFKQLKLVLKRSRPRVQRVDRHVIALACQLGAGLCSTDPGIDKVLIKAKATNRFKPWKQYANRVVMQKP